MRKSKKLGIAMLLASPILLYSGYKINQYAINKCNDSKRNPSIARVIQLEELLQTDNRKPYENIQMYPSEFNEYLSLMKRNEIIEGVHNYRLYCPSNPMQFLPQATLLVLGVVSLIMGVEELRGIYHNENQENS